MSTNEGIFTFEDVPSNTRTTSTRSSPWATPQAQSHRRDSLDEEDFPPLSSDSDSGKPSTTNQIDSAKEDARIAALIRNKPTSKYEVERPQEFMMSGGLSEDDERCELGNECALRQKTEEQNMEQPASTGEGEQKGWGSVSDGDDDYSDDSSNGGYGSDEYDDGVQYGAGTQWGWL